MKKVLLHNNWKMHRSDKQEWNAATVPGSVYGDLLNAGKMENPFWKVPVIHTHRAERSKGARHQIVSFPSFFSSFISQTPVSPMRVPR